MRIRFKKWARPELEASKFYIDEPEKYKGKWRTLFENNSPLYVELGCGKGGFISQIASENLNINYIAIDLVDAMLGLAKRNIEEVYAEKNEEINNVLISRYDIDRILNVFDENDKIDEIQVISNNGEIIKSKTFNSNLAKLEFTLKSNKNKFYYIKVIQNNDKISVTAPIWIE